MITSRRSLVRGIAALSAPAVVTASSLMPVSARALGGEFDPAAVGLGERSTGRPLPGTALVSRVYSLEDVVVEMLRRSPAQEAIIEAVLKAQRRGAIA